MPNDQNKEPDTEGSTETQKTNFVELRPYQIDSRERIYAAWERGHRSVMYQSPTGSGKTATIGSIVKAYADAGLKTLTIAHRGELIDNIKKEYWEMFGVETRPIKANLPRDYSVPHQVASTATYVNALDFDPDLIITDEGHHCIAPTYLTIYAAHPKAKLLMVTATPYRLSGLGFRDICEELVLGLSVLQLERMGSIVPAKLFAMRTYTREQIAQVKLVHGEYSEQQMSDLLSENDQIMSVVDTYIEHGEGKQMMLYATNVLHSEKLKDAFLFRGIAADHVDGKSKHRKEAFANFANKQIQVLSNCEIATEGNNIPGIEIIGLARKTKSLSMYLQMVGRGSRPVQGKLSYLLFDFVDNYWEHGLPNREHDWQRHFIGLERGEKKIRDAEEKRFQVRAVTGEVFISSLNELPSGFKGQILHEVNPYNTRHAEILRRQAEKLAAAERKKAEKQAEIERRIAAKEAEIERRRAEKEAAIQKKKDDKLAAIQRKKEAKEAELLKKWEAAQKRIADREAAKQHKIDAKLAEIQRKKDAVQKIIDDRIAAMRHRQEQKEAEIQRKEAAKQAEIDRKEAVAQQKIRQRDAYYQRVDTNSQIIDVQRERRDKRWQENAARELAQSNGYKARQERVTEELKVIRDNTDMQDHLARHARLYEIFAENSEAQKLEKLEGKRILQAQRMEVQFEISVRSTHSLGKSLLRVSNFCSEKRYPKPNIATLQAIALPYINEQIFTQQQFEEAITTLKQYGEVAI